MRCEVGSQEPVVVFVGGPRVRGVAVQDSRLFAGYPEPEHRVQPRTCRDPGFDQSENALKLIRVQRAVVPHVVERLRHQTECRKLPPLVDSRC